jgi:hypothetical protein
MDRSVEVGEELTTAGHVVGGAAVEVPAIHLVLAGVNVEERTSSGFVDVEVGVGLGIEDILLCF